MFFGKSSLIISIIESFIFLYPLLMSLFWIAGTIIFSLSKEKRDNSIDISKYNWPKISIVVPCYNEVDVIGETIENLSKLPYPDYEIIAVNDGSKDNTGKILIDLSKKYSKLRVIDCKENKGKANALHLALHASTGEYLLCIDSDALLDDDAPYYLIHHFMENGERLGAVTGNPRIRNRDTLLGQMQLVEYSSIIGSIKRSQRVLGKIMTVSGVVVAFRKKALIDVGLWDRDMITEDIAVSWKLQKRFWDIRYEPRAMCWMLVPETISGIFKQRVRWAQGGQEVLIRHWDIFKSWKQRRIWIIYIEQIFSTLWSFCWFAATLYLIFFSKSTSITTLWFAFNSFSLVLFSHIQLIMSIILDSKYDDIRKHYLVAAWYPALYWMINTIVVIVAAPKAIISSIKGGYAVWDSPDRGKIADL